MAFPVSAALLDAIVLAVVSREGTYGYKITQDVRAAMAVSALSSVSCPVMSGCFAMPASLMALRTPSAMLSFGAMMMSGACPASAPASSFFMRASAFSGFQSFVMACSNVFSPDGMTICPLWMLARSSTAWALKARWKAAS